MAAAAWRRAVRAELRRSRQYLVTLLEDLDEEELYLEPARPGAVAIAWHVGRVAMLERRQLAMLVTGLRADDTEWDEPFTRRALAKAATRLPPWKKTWSWLRSVRRLTTALVAQVEPDECADVFLEIVNAEYEQAAHVLRARRELGRAAPEEPRGNRILVDTDGELAPRFHLASWDVPRPERRGARDASVVSMAEHRQARAGEALERGHRLVATGDHRGALAAFHASAALVRTADALAGQGRMHVLLGDPERGEQLCQQAIELDPDFGNAHVDLGSLFLQRRDVTRAIECFERAKRARRYELREEAYLNLGRLYLALGLPEKALREFEGALAHAPANDEARQAAEQLRRQLDRREGS